MNHINVTEIHLQKMKDAKVDWVRLDVIKPLDNSQEVFKKAHDLGLKVIGVVTSKRMLRDLGFSTRKYFPKSDWGRKWRKSVEETASLFDPYVEIWQIDNELNHLWHNLIPSMNTRLALDIVESGADAVRKVNPDAKLAVNLFYELKGPFHIPGPHIIRDKPFIRKFRERLGNKIDILGLDIYRGTWHLGGPQSYPEDVMRYRKLWEGDIMIMETGFCTGIFGRSESDQANYVRQVFRCLDNYFEDAPWFRGIVWYVFSSSHAGMPCENFFGLHKDDDFAEKPAWKEFTEKAKMYNKSGKIIGITHHY